jgi:hypothetical protein
MYETISEVLPPAVKIGSDETVHLRIDGREVEAHPSDLLLEVVLGKGHSACLLSLLRSWDQFRPAIHINPDDLHGVLEEAEGKPPSFFQIVRRMALKDTRRALGAFGAVLNIFEADLGRKKGPA